MTARDGKLRVLFFGDPNSGYEGYFAKHLKESSPACVDMLTFARGESDMWREHRQIFDQIHCLRGDRDWPIFKTIGRLFGAFRQVAALPDYDVCHVQFYSPKKALFLPILRRKCRRMIISFWGSDVNKTTLPERLLQVWGLRFADAVTFQNDGLRDIFCNRYQQKARPNFRTIWLGLDLIGLVDSFRKQGVTREAAKRQMGVDPERICIVCGTYASRDQNHHAIIAALEERMADFPKEIHLLVPLTYGDPVYRAEVVARLEKSPLMSTVFDKFLPDETVAQIWLATDILVQVLAKDAFSGATQECLFAGGIIVTGSWLPYDILKENGVRFLEVDSLDQLGQTLADAVHNIERLRTEFSGNPAIIWNLSSWPSAIQRWLELYFAGSSDSKGSAAGGAR